MAAPEKDKSLETSHDVHDKEVNKKKDEKRKAAEINGGEGDSSVLRQENVDGNDQVEIKKKKKKKLQGDENGVEKPDRKKMKKNQESIDNNQSGASSVQVGNNGFGHKDFSQSELAKSGPDKVHNSEGVEKKEKLQEDENGVEKQYNNKKKRSRENGDDSNNHSTVQESVLGVKVFTEAERAENGPDEVHNYGVEVKKKKKKKMQEKNESVIEKQDSKKKKKNKKKNAVNGEVNSKAKLAENGPDEVYSNEGAKVNTKKKKKSREDENGAETRDREKKKKNKKENDGNHHNLSPVQEEAISNEGAEANNKKKKKTKNPEDTNPTPNKSNKKVRFSNQDEVFTVPAKSSDGGEEVEDLVIGKRFTREEDSLVEKAVYDYVEEHGLGENGLEMVLNSRKHQKEVKGCWREIAEALPHRPRMAVYNRAQVLFRRSESRSWTQEEYDMVLKHQELHGNEWKSLADELGKHHWHVKDAYRRIKLPNRNKGHWNQKEYQSLFDLVNADLLLKVSEEKKSKHGMLRDNICWTGISDRMETRAMATCCMKWYNQMTSPMVAAGIWSDGDDYRLIGALYGSDENCVEDVDWDNLVEGRPGEVCRRRWRQMWKHIGFHGKETFAGQVEVLARRYCPHLVEAREAWDKKPFVDVKKPPVEVEQ